MFSNHCRPIASTRHSAGALAIPTNLTLLFPPATSPDLNLQVKVGE
jgi:hypothetical protein